ncbi:MAG: tetratricopeptide repeat protein [Nitrospirae bacterium]|jgi:tetratricopeptide (TPR) repeat protein|nr:tetratricopeptide repeat protein [Nitrospirota bacterium]
MLNEPHNKRIIIFGLIVFAVAFIIYLPTIWNRFVWDDIQLITHPLNLGKNPYSFFLGGGIYYRPFLHLSMAIDYSFWHLNPMGYHLTNVLLHSIASLLVFLTGLLIIRKKSVNDEFENKNKRIILPALLSAIIFAIHPIHTESVAWISGRTDILSTIFLLLAFLSFLIYSKESKFSGLILTCIFFLFSLFSKENAFSLILIILIYSLLIDMPRKKIALSLSSLSLVIIIYFILRQSKVINMMISSPGTENAFFSADIQIKNIFSILMGAIGYYFQKLLLPLNLNLLPDIPKNPLIFLIGFSPFLLAIILYFKRHNFVFFLISWIILTLLPSLFILVSQIGSPIGERYLYLPSVGFCILAGFLFSKISNKKLLFTSFAIIAISGSFLTYERIKVWENDLTLWKDTVSKSPSSAIAHANYGRALLEKNDFEQGRKELLIALQQKKISAELVSIIMDMLGVVEMRDKNYQKAESYFKESLKAYSKNVTALSNFGILYLRMSESIKNEEEKKSVIEKAISNIEKALSISPGFIQARFNLGLCYLQIKEYDKAQKYFESVIELDPRSSLSNEAMQLLLITEFAKRNIPIGK